MLSTEKRLIGVNDKVPACFRGGFRFEPGPHSIILETILEKLYLLLLCLTHKTNSESSGNALVFKQAQPITMHSWDLQTKVIQSKGWLSVVCY